MPAFYDMPKSFATFASEDPDRLQKLPYYLVKNEVKQFPTWNVFEQLLSDISWQPNEGNVMRAVTPQRSPVGRALFFPNPITTVPNKDVYQVTESQENAIVYAHTYESFQFNFVPSFNSFWKNYIQFADNDVVSKIGISHNQFLETNMWFSSQYAFLCGTGIVSTPSGLGNSTLTAAGSKTAAWLIAATQPGNNTGVQQNLTLRDIYNASMALTEDFGAPPFEGTRNMPKDNEGIKGKYALITSNEAWMSLPFDPDIMNKLNGLAPCDLNLLFNDFKGLLFGTIVAKINRYPLRFNIVNVNYPDGSVLYPAGTFIPPEIFDQTDNKWKPNPSWTSRISAPYEVSWLMGADFGKSIKVGPPPKEFAERNMAAEKFYELRWNGETRIIDQVLVQYADGTYDINNYATQVKIISMLTHGYLPCERRYAFPIIAERKRPTLLAA